MDNAIELAAQIKKDVDKYCVETYGKEFNTRLGASIIGHDCKRFLWYSFRWAFKAVNDARMLRLGQRGNLEEARFIEYLRGIGCQVWAHVPKVLHYHPESESYFIEQEFTDGDGLCVDVSDQPAHIQRAFEQFGLNMKPEQYRMSGVMGHLGGSLDGIVILPSYYNYDKPLLLEGKTHGTGSGFNKLVEQGMKATKREHYIQNSLYGYKYGFEHVLYLNTNKNDDSLHIEIERLDWELAKTVEAKAEFIILAQEAPPKVSPKPDSAKCNACPAKAVCHEGAPAERNCRSCKHATPVDNAQWYCNLPQHDSVIPKHIIPQACDSYVSIV